MEAAHDQWLVYAQLVVEESGGYGADFANFAADVAAGEGGADARFAAGGFEFLDVFVVEIADGTGDSVWTWVVKHLQMLVGEKSAGYGAAAELVVEVEVAVGDYLEMSEMPSVDGWQLIWEVVAHGGCVGCAKEQQHFAFAN